MTATNYTTATNQCDFCGDERDKEDLLLIVANPEKGDWREVVCIDCHEFVGPSKGVSSFGLTVLVGAQ